MKNKINADYAQPILHSSFFIKKNNMSPSIAIIDPNTLATIGLKTILQDIMPIMQVDIYGSFAELQANNPEQ